MGSACSKGPKVNQETRELDMMLEEEKKKSALHFKILVLGAGESGKSTLVKQLKFIHKRKMEEEEQQGYVSVLMTNAIESCQIFTRHCQEMEEEEGKIYADGWTEEEKQWCEDVQQTKTLTPELGTKIIKLWNSEPLQKVYARRMEFWHLEASDFYMENAERFCEEDFIPSEDDIVMARKRTTGVVVTEFDYAKVQWEVVDVGGQRSERRKWMHFFQDVKAILFIVNASGYNKVLFEDKNVNRLQESLNLFQDTAKTPIFKDTPFFVFLNKKDLFENMLKDTPLTRMFPDFTGDSNNVQECLDFIGTKFQEKLPPGKAPAYIHAISARVKKDVKNEFDEVKDCLLNVNKKTIDAATKDLAKFEKKKEKHEEEKAKEEEKRQIADAADKRRPYEEVEEAIRLLCADKNDLKLLWDEAASIYASGDSKISLSNAGKFVQSKWPELSNEEALKAAFLWSTSRAGDGDKFIDKTEFGKFLGGVAWHNKVYFVFDSANGEDKTLEKAELKNNAMQLGLNLRTADLDTEWQLIDPKGSGKATVKEFAAWYATKQAAA